MINFSFNSFDQLRAIEAAFMAIKQDRVKISFGNGQKLTPAKSWALKVEAVKIAASWDLSDFLEMGQGYGDFKATTQNINALATAFLEAAIGSINDGKWEDLDLHAEVMEA